MTESEGRMGRLNSSFVLRNSLVIQSLVIPLLYPPERAIWDRNRRDLGRILNGRMPGDSIEETRNCVLAATRKVGPSMLMMGATCVESS
jgi:hypothetical protein